MSFEIQFSVSTSSQLAPMLDTRSGAHFSLQGHAPQKGHTLEFRCTNCPQQYIDTIFDLSPSTMFIPKILLLVCLFCLAGTSIASELRANEDQSASPRLFYRASLLLILNNVLINPSSHLSCPTEPPIAIWFSLPHGSLPQWTWRGWRRPVRYDPIHHVWTRGDAMLQSQNLEGQVPRRYQTTHVLHWLRPDSLLSDGGGCCLLFLLTRPLLSIREPMRFGWCGLQLRSLVVIFWKRAPFIPWIKKRFKNAAPQWLASWQVLCWYKNEIARS